MGQPRPSGSSGEPEREEGNQYGRSPAKCSVSELVS